MTPHEIFRQAKAAEPDCIILVESGDFFELFEDDAKTAARSLGLSLTTRQHNGQALAMAGFPTRYLDAYLAKLVAAGHRAAVVSKAAA